VVEKYFLSAIVSRRERWSASKTYEDKVIRAALLPLLGEWSKAGLKGLMGQEEEKKKKKKKKREERRSRENKKRGN
jgi:hypothetical protein